MVNGCKPIFSLNQNGPSYSNNLFKISLHITIQNIHIKTIGQGTTKKEAKQKAAQLALDKLKAMNLWSEQPKAKVVNPEPIIQLAELCDDYSLPRPKYIFVQEEGPNHAKTFTINCKVADKEQMASAATKQAAKKLSAGKMIDFLKNKNNSTDDDDEPIPESTTFVNKNFEGSICPYESDCKGKCLKAIDILKNESLNPKEKVRKALKALTQE